MDETFLALLTGHLIAEFLIGKDWLRKWFCEFFSDLFQSVIGTITSLFLLGNFNQDLFWGAMGILALIDLIGSLLSKAGWRSFVIEWLVFVLAICVLSTLWPDAAKDGFWPTIFDAACLPQFYAMQCLVAGILVVVPVGGVLIGKLIGSIGEEIGNPSPIVQSPHPSSHEVAQNRNLTAGGLNNGGKYIGWLERFLTLLLIMIEQPEGIGFLITAKSILRFGEIKDTHDRKLAEYIIIGTLLSFGWALMMSVATSKAMSHWIPETYVEVKGVKVIVEQQGGVSRPPIGEKHLNDHATPLMPLRMNGNSE